MTFVRLYPAKHVNGVSREIDQVFNQLFGGPSVFRNNVDQKWQPRVDVVETADAFVLTAELPGVNKDDLAIRFEDGVLTLEGERKRSDAENTNYLRSETVYGKFNRSLKVNTRVKEDAIDARFENGLLTVSIPKAEEVKPREIKIKTSRAKTK